MHRFKNELNKLISNTILVVIVQLHQLKTQTVPVHIKKHRLKHKQYYKNGRATS